MGTHQQGRFVLDTRMVSAYCTPPQPQEARRNSSQTSSCMHGPCHTACDALQCWVCLCQVEVALSQLKVESCTSEEHLVCLEALARLAWSDDTIRELVANSGGVRSLVDVMTLHSSSDSIQCHACLALMSLVRGEGEVCQSNQWHVAKAGAIEVIAKAMQQFRYGTVECQTGPYAA